MTRFTYAQRWAGCAASIGRAMGIELASLGINLNFAPILDVDSNPDNPVIGMRSFGRDPGVVTERACEFMRGLEQADVRACGKHFPGHGDTSVDSHLELPVLAATAETLRHREIRPFEGAIAEGLGMIMTSHILFKDLDPLLPATLSPRIVNDLLRTKLGFKGVVVSDDIGMRAVSGLFDDKAVAPRFLSAGNDMLMICAHWTNTERARFFATALLEGLTSGELDQRITEHSKERITTMLNETQQHSVKQLSAQVLQEHAAVGPLFTGGAVEMT
jgi:beta-N-acetylhexosaminidase